MGFDPNSFYLRTIRPKTVLCFMKALVFEGTYFFYRNFSRSYGDFEENIDKVDNVIYPEVTRETDFIKDKKMQGLSLNRLPISTLSIPIPQDISNLNPEI